MSASIEISPEDRPAGHGRRWRSIGDLALAAIEKKPAIVNAPCNARQQSEGNVDAELH